MRDAAISKPRAGQEGGKTAARRPMLTRADGRAHARPLACDAVRACERMARVPAAAKHTAPIAQALTETEHTHSPGLKLGEL